MEYHHNPEQLSEREIELWQALDDGQVIQFSWGLLDGMFIRKLAELGPCAYEVSHPQSTVDEYSAIIGRMIAAAVIETDRASVSTVMSEREVAERGVFSDSEWPEVRSE